MEKPGHQSTLKIKLFLSHSCVRKRKTHEKSSACTVFNCVDRIVRQRVQQDLKHCNQVKSPHVFSSLDSNKTTPCSNRAVQSRRAKPTAVTQSSFEQLVHAVVSCTLLREAAENISFLLSLWAKIFGVVAIRMVFIKLNSSFSRQKVETAGNKQVTDPLRDSRPSTMFGHPLLHFTSFFRKTEDASQRIGLVLLNSILDLLESDCSQIFVVFVQSSSRDQTDFYRVDKDLVGASQPQNSSQTERHVLTAFAKTSLSFGLHE